MLGRKFEGPVQRWGYLVRLTAAMGLCFIVIGSLPEADARRTVEMRLRGRQDDYRRRIRAEVPRLTEVISGKEEELRNLGRSGMSDSARYRRQRDLQNELQELRAELSDVQRQLREPEYLLARERANARFWANFRGEHGETAQRDALAMARRRGYRAEGEFLPLPPRTFLADPAQATQGTATSAAPPTSPPAATSTVQ